MARFPRRQNGVTRCCHFTPVQPQQLLSAMYKLTRNNCTDMSDCHGTTFTELILQRACAAQNGRGQRSRALNGVIRGK